MPDLVLDAHRRKIPIDHPESSILFAHLAKEVKEEFLRLALSTLMNRALLNAETKDFYVILADVITTDYPLGYYETIERKPARTPITITEQSGNDLTDYAIKIVLDDTWDGWDIVIDGSDIYFLDDQGNPLYYWIEEFDKQNKHAIIWVKIPSLSANSSITIYMHYGTTPNPYAEYNDPEQVFMFFDDFEGDAIDTTKWGNTGGTVTVSNSVLSFYSGAKGTWYSIYSIKTFNEPIVLEMKFKMDNPNPGESGHGKNIGLSNYYAEAGSHDFAWFAWSSLAGEYQVQTGNEGSGVQESSPYSFLDWGIGKIEWIPATSVKYYYNDNLIAEHTSNIPDEAISVELLTAGNGYIYVDWVLIRPYVDHEPSVSIGASEIEEVETTNLDFPDGVDKILVTIDSDAQEAYYSTDGGQTWNALTLDEEIQLPSTATQLKLKFSKLTYFRGYALIGW